MYGKWGKDTCCWMFMLAENWDETYTSSSDVNDVLKVVSCYWSKIGMLETERKLFKLDLERNQR